MASKSYNVGAMRKEFKFTRDDDEIMGDAYTARKIDKKVVGSSNESSQQILEVLLDIRELLNRLLQK